MGGSASSEVAGRVAGYKGYTVDKVLGEGAFGVVYAAKSSTGEDVAMKICQTSATSFNEAQTLGSLLSPYVVELKEYYTVKVGQKTVCALVMEFCALGDLAHYLSACSPPKEQRLVWCYEMSAGLAYIHSQGIVHRDIKPANILISSKGHVKLGDVGLAKAAFDLGANMDPSASEMSFEQYYMNEYTGTRPYMAPEVYDRHYQKQSDLFSLGLVFVVMAEKPPGLIPYTSKWTCLGKELNENPNARRRDPTALLAIVFRNTTPEEMEIYNQMLAHSYRDRMAANDVAQAFRAMLRRQGIEIPQPQANCRIVLPEEGGWWGTLAKGALLAGALYVALASQKR